MVTIHPSCSVATSEERVPSLPEIVHGLYETDILLHAPAVYPRLYKYFNLRTTVVLLITEDSAMPVVASDRSKDFLRGCVSASHMNLLNISTGVQLLSSQTR